VDDAGSRRPVVVIANPTAGRGKAGTLIGKVDAILRGLGIDHTVRVSESAADMERLARAAADDGAEIVAALGGDGSLPPRRPPRAWNPTLSRPRPRPAVDASGNG